MSLSQRLDPAAAEEDQVNAKTKSKAKGRSKRSDAGAGTRWTDARERVRDHVLAELGPRLSGQPIDDVDDLEGQVREVLDRVLRDAEDVDVSPAERRRFIDEVTSDLLGYGPLDMLIADPSVSEIMCNRSDEVWVERSGAVEMSDVSFSSDAQYRQVIEKIVNGVGRRVDESSPMVDARLPNGYRVNVILPPLAVNGPALTIRKFAEEALDVAELVRLGTFTEGLAQFLDGCVRGKLNVLVSGGTSTGKTTLLNVLSSFIGDAERIITVEDAAELQLQQPHVVTLESRPPNAEGAGEVRIRELVRNALRMRPDRIVVGEVRGAEALDMLQAMNTGHEGSLATIHANSPRDALSRLEMLVLMAGYDLPVRAIREQIAAAIDVVVQLDRLRSGVRKISSVQEVQGMEDDVITLQELFRLERGGDEGPDGSLRPTGLRPRLLERLESEGVPLPASMFRAGAGPDAAPNGNGARRGRNRKTTSDDGVTTRRTTSR